MGVRVTWKVVAVSVPGTAHIASGHSCQDNCQARLHQVGSDQELLSIFASDGAGSASHGEQGAILAIDACVAHLATKLVLPEFAINDELAVECVIAVRECIYMAAERESLRARDYACTFLGVISNDQATLVLQIGDGGIALDSGHGLVVPVKPMSGEYANMTNFVTDENAIEVLATKVYPGRANRVAVFTDGMQRLALNMSTNTAHEPFFDPLFRVLSLATSEQESQLEAALSAFLNSEAVNERTDDDKTLVLAIDRERICDDEETDYE